MNRPYIEPAEFSTFRAVRRRKFTIAALALVCGAAALAGAASRAPVHEVDSSLLFRFAREYFPVDPAANGWQGDQIRVDLGDAIHTELAVIGSHRVMAAALDTVGGVAAWEAAKPPVDPVGRLAGFVGARVDEARYAIGRAAAAYGYGGAPAVSPGEAVAAAVAGERVLGEVRDALSIRRIEGTSVAMIAMRHADPAFATAYVNALVETYLNGRRALFGAPPVAVLEEKAEAATVRLAAAEAELARHAAETDLHDVSLQREQLLAERARIGAAMAADFERAETARAPVAELAETRADQTATERRIAVQAAERANARAVAEAAAEVEAIAIRRDLRRMQLVGIGEALSRLAVAEARQATLQRAVEDAKAERDQVEGLLRQHRLSADLAAASAPLISVIDPAVPNDRRIGLSPLVQGVLGALLGLVLGVVLAVVEAHRRAPRVLAFRSSPLPDPTGGMGAGSAGAKAGFTGFSMPAAKVGERGGVHAERA